MKTSSLSAAAMNSETGASACLRHSVAGFMLHGAWRSLQSCGLNEDWKSSPCGRMTDLCCACRKLMNQCDSEWLRLSPGGIARPCTESTGLHFHVCSQIPRGCVACSCCCRAGDPDCELRYGSSENARRIYWSRLSVFHRFLSCLKPIANASGTYSTSLQRLAY